MELIGSVVVVVVVDVVVVVVGVVVTVVVPAIWRRPAVAGNVSQQRQGRAGLIQSGPRPIRRAGED